MSTELIGYDEIVGYDEYLGEDELIGAEDALDELLSGDEVGARRRRMVRRRRAPQKVGILCAGVPVTNIADGATTEITVPVADPFRPDTLVLSAAARAAGVSILDIKVGTVSQNVSSGPIPAEVFAPDARWTRLNGSTAQPGVGITLSVRNTSGSSIAFSGVFYGRAIGK